MVKGTSRDTTLEQGASFGRRLKQLREAAGLTQEELASRAGLSATAVSVLERGERKRPYPHTVRSLADALGLSEDERATLLAALPGRDATATPVAAPASMLEPTLPSPPTSLVGRERELTEIGELLGGSKVRLLTLTGIGGVGKSRLAMAAAHEAGGQFPDGVTFVALAPLRDPALVVSTIARSLGLREEQGQSAAEALRVHLRQKRTLLVLDNFEHLLGAATEVVHLIETCPGVVLLATSRAPLRVRGEQEYPVPPLALPPSTLNPSKEEVLGTPSGRLFVERARAASPSFALTTENAPSVAAICWRLAGLPLALELAATKARFLEPAALLSRLDEVLSNAWVRDLPERQRTMRAALDWSYELLSPPERELFRRLSVFSGGFSIEAAEAVGAEADEGSALLGLEVLVEHSLVVFEPSAAGPEARYGMLEPVRQYAGQKLEESGKYEEIVRRHAEYFLALAERAAPEMWGPGQAAWLDRLERESDNLRAAISRSLDAGELETATRFGWALWLFWYVHGHHGEGRRWAEAMMEHDLPPPLRARVLPMAASMAFTRGDHQLAEGYWREALPLARREGDELAEAYAQLGVGLAAMPRADYEAAASSMEESIALFERCGVGYLATAGRVWLGTAFLALGESERAERTFEEGLMSARRMKDPTLTCLALYKLAQMTLARGDHAGAARMLGEGITLSEQTKDRISLAYFLEALAALASSRGEAERSAVLLGAAESSLRGVGAPVRNYFPDPSLRERPAVEARAVLGDAAFEEARERGREMSFEQAVEYALEDDEASPA